MKLLLIDALNLIRRIHGAIPSDGSQHQETKRVEKSIHSSTLSISRALTEHRPTHCIAVFEDGEHSWRHNLLPSYKKNRPSMPSELRNSLSTFKQCFLQIGVKSFSFYAFEADDVIATLATKASKKNAQTIILSTDKLQAQLLSDNVQIYNHFSRSFIDNRVILEKFSVPHNQLVDLFALAGDSSHSISGIKSIGIRTAAKLLNDYGSLDNIMQQASKIEGSLGTKLVNGADDARLAEELFRLRTDLNLGINLNEFRYIEKLAQDHS